jgi:hypothetical protein
MLACGEGFYRIRLTGVAGKATGQALTSLN